MNKLINENQIKAGNVFLIPLTGNQYRLGVICNDDVSICISKILISSINEIDKLEKYFEDWLFNVWLSAININHSDWKVVGKIDKPFIPDPGLKYNFDGKSYALFYREGGLLKQKDVSQEEVIGYEIAKYWSYQEIVSRIENRDAKLIPITYLPSFPLIHINKFRDTIKKSKVGFSGDYSMAVVKAIKSMNNYSQDEKTGFVKEYTKKMNALDTERNLAAANIIFGGASEDLFIEFKSWLVFNYSDHRNKTLINNIIENPDVLAPLLPGLSSDDLERGVMGAYSFYIELKKHIENEVGKKSLENRALKNMEFEINIDLDNQENLKKVLPNLFNKFNN